MPPALKTVAHHQVAAVVQVPLRSCTNTVVYYLEQATRQAHQFRFGMGSNFFNFLSPAAPARMKNSAKFLSKMAIQHGTRRKQWPKNLTKTRVVVFIDPDNTTIAAHACIYDPDNKELYGYNQRGWFGCNDVQHTHCNHNVSAIVWENKKVRKHPDNPALYKIYTIKDFWARHYYDNWRDDASKW